MNRGHNSPLQFLQKHEECLRKPIFNLQRKRVELKTLSSPNKINVLEKNGLDVNDEIIRRVLTMFGVFNTGVILNVDLPVLTPTLLVPCSRVFVRPIKKPFHQRDLTIYEPKQKSKGIKRSLRKLPLPDKVQYLVLKGRWSPIFKIAMCLN